MPLFFLWDLRHYSFFPLAFFGFAGHFLFYSLSEWPRLILQASIVLLVLIEFTSDFLEDLDFLTEQFFNNFASPFKSTLAKTFGSIKKHDTLEVLKNIPILQTLDTETIGSMARSAKTLYFRRGLPVFGEGQEGTELYFVLKGKLNDSKKIRAGTGVRSSH